jgi:hypothetical protein
MLLSISIYLPRKPPIMLEYSTSAGFDEIIEDLKQRFKIGGYNLKKVLIRSPKGVYETCPESYPRVLDIILPKLGLPVAVCGVLEGEAGDLVISVFLEEERPYEKQKAV